MDLEICADSNEFDVDEEELILLIPPNPTSDPGRPSKTASSATVYTNSDSRGDTRNSSDESDEEYQSSRKRRKTVPVFKDRTDSSSFPDYNVEKASSPKTESAFAELPNLRNSPVARRPAASTSHPVYRKNGPVSIHINKHFRGAVQAAPGTCLAWDPVVAGANFRGPSIMGGGGNLPGLRSPFGNIPEGIRYGSSAIAARFPIMRPVLPLNGVISPGLPLAPLMFRPDLMAMRAKPPFLPIGGILPMACDFFPPMPSMPLNMSSISRLRSNSIKMNQHRSRGNFGPSIAQFKRHRNK